MARTLKELAAAEKLQLDAFSKQIESLTKTSGEKLEAVRTTVETQLQSMKADNATQLEQMRLTVDEKLQGTLEKRLGESFKQVSDVWNNPSGAWRDAIPCHRRRRPQEGVDKHKARGTWGEVQIGALLERC